MIINKDIILLLIFILFFDFVDNNRLRIISQYYSLIISKYNNYLTFSIFKIISWFEVSSSSDRITWFLFIFFSFVKYKEIFNTLFLPIFSDSFSLLKEGDILIAISFRLVNIWDILSKVSFWIGVISSLFKIQFYAFNLFFIEIKNWLQEVKMVQSLLL